jgi:hypothetical protein
VGKRAIELVDVEALRAKLATAPEDAEPLLGPYREALAEYDAFKAKGGDPILYVDRGALIVAAKHPLPMGSAEPCACTLHCDGMKTTSDAVCRRLPKLEDIARPGSEGGDRG